MKIDSASLSSLHSSQLSSIKTTPESGSTAKPANQLSSASLSDKVTLSRTEDEGKADPANRRIFNVSDKAAAGAMSQVHIGESETLDRIRTAFERLDGDQQQQLIDLGIFDRESFLNVAEKLDDEELGKLLNVVDGLQTPPKLHRVVIDPDGITSASTTKSFIDKLSTMDDESLKRVLSKAGNFADKVAPHSEPITYQRNGFYAQYEASPSANDLHNFAFAVTKTDDVNQMMDSLEEFDERQQSQLLVALGTNANLGNRVMENLTGREKSAQDSALNYLTGLIEESRYTYKNDTPEIGHRYTEDGRTWGDVDFDNYTAAPELIEGALDLMESYEFSDEQLQQMTDQLNDLDRSDQRAYLAITATGLEHLLGGTAENPISLDENQDALATIDALRNNDTIRDTIFMSRMGLETGVSGNAPYEIKAYGSGLHDQQEMIKLLTTDAWLNQGDTSRSATLASKLDQLDANQRDAFISKTNALSNSAVPLAQQSAESLQQLYEPLLNRTNTLINTEDVADLFAAEETMPQGQKENFWKATELAEENVDKLVDMLLENSSNIREQIVENLAKDADLVDSGEKSRDDAQSDLNDLIDYFSQDHRTESQKHSYLERA